MKAAWRFLVGTIVSIAVLGLLIETINHLREQSPPPPPAVRLSLTAPAGTQLGAADEPLDAAISPDQREVVFVATQLRRNATDQVAAGSTQLWRRRLDAEDAEPIAGTEGAQLPAWKQTGNVLSFFADAQLKLVNLKTGAVTVVTDAPAPAGATWLHDGSLLFVPGPGVIRRLLDGRVTDATRLAAGERAHAYPMAVAPSQDFVYIAAREDGRRVVRLNERGQESDLGDTAAHAVLADADARTLLFVKDGTLLADEREADTGRLVGRDLPVALEVGMTRSGRGLFTASADVLIHAPAAERPQQLTWLTMDGTRSATVADIGDYWQVRLAPDDRNLAVTARDPLLRSLDVLTFPVVGASPAVRLTASLAADSDPVWSSDGRRLLFRSMQRGRPEVFVTPATIEPATSDESRARPIKTTGEVPTDWHGGEMLIQRRGTAGFDVVRVDEATGATTVVAGSPFNETEGRWSPNGRWIAYVSDESGKPDIYVVPFGSAPAAPSVGAGSGSAEVRQRFSFGGGTHPRWTRDSRALLFLRGSMIMRADLNAEGTRFESPRPLFDAPGIRDFDVAHQTDRIVALLPAQADAVTDVSVVLNWQSLLPAEESPKARGRQRR